MSNKFILFACFFVLFGCGKPDKEKTVTSDSLETPTGDSLMYDPVPADTLTLDSINAIDKIVFNKNDSQTYYVLTNYLADPEEKTRLADVQTIDSTCAIIVYPTEEQLSSLKQENPDDYTNLLDIYGYYQGLAIQMLDSIDITTIEAEKRYLLFKGKRSRSWKLDIHKEGAPSWNLIFFNINKEPRIIFSRDLSHNKVIEYFDKK